MSVILIPDAILVMLEVKTYTASTPQMYRSCGMCADCEIPDHSILVWINQLLLYDFCYSTFILNLTVSIWHNEAYSPFISPNASQIIWIIICFKWRSNWNDLENHQLLSDKIKEYNSGRSQILGGQAWRWHWHWKVWGISVIFILQTVLCHCQDGDILKRSG